MPGFRAPQKLVVDIDYPVFKVKVGFLQPAEFRNPKPCADQYE